MSLIPGLSGIRRNRRPHLRGTSRRYAPASPLRAAVAVALLAAVAAALTGFAPAVRAQTEGGIVPGASIGPARLGMTEEALASFLGSSTALGPTRRFYPQHGLVIDFQWGVAIRIATTTARYRTFAGAGVGTGAQDAARLVGDINEVTTLSRLDTTVWYEFQGIGFVFRGGRAVEAFVVEPVAFGTKPAAPGAPGNPGAPQSAPQSTAVQPSGPSALVRDLKVDVRPSGVFSLAGTVVNTGSAPVGPVAVDGMFTGVSGNGVEAKITIQNLLAPGEGAPFTLQVDRMADVIIRYQVSVMTMTGAILVTSDAASVPPSAYADFARRQIRVRADVGAPSVASGPQSVQIVVTVSDTGAIPQAWIQQVSVQVPYSGHGTVGVQNTQVRPGQQQTVVIPANATLGSPLVTGVVLAGG
jgi:hypothetical protein